MIKKRTNPVFKVIDNLLDVRQAADLFGVTVLSIHNWQDCCGMPHLRIKGALKDSIRYDRQELIEWARKTGRRIRLPKRDVEKRSA